MGGPPDTDTSRSAPAVVVVLLAVASGTIDATALLFLGGVFSSVVTGSMVLLGLSLARSSWGTAVRAAESLVAYAAGAAGGGWFTGRRAEPGRKRFVPLTMLAVEAVLLAGLWAGWLLGHDRPAGDDQLVLLALGGIAMGLQSIAVSAFGGKGVSTTYLTGALTRLVSQAADRTARTEVDRMQLVAFVGVVAGAAVGALLDIDARFVGPALAPVCVLAALSLRARQAPSTPRTEGSDWPAGPGQAS